MQIRFGGRIRRRGLIQGIKYPFDPRGLFGIDTTPVVLLKVARQPFMFETFDHNVL